MPMARPRTVTRVCRTSVLPLAPSPSAIAQAPPAWRSWPSSRRRIAQAVDGPARDRLERWGCPHVLDGWRFHLTLSDPRSAAPPAEREALTQAAVRHFAAALARRSRVASIAVFEQAAPELAFRLARRLPLSL